MKRRWITTGIFISTLLILGTGCTKKQEQENVQEGNSRESHLEGSDEKGTFDQERETEIITDIISPETETGRPETYDEQGNIVYEYKDLKITLPSSWEGRYDVTSSDGYVGFWRKDGEGGDYAPGIARKGGGYVFGIYFIKEQYCETIRNFGIESVIGTKDDGYYLLCGIELDTNESSDDASADRLDMYFDVSWIAEHVVVEGTEPSGNPAVEAMDGKTLPEEASGTLTGIFVGGDIEKDDDIIYLWTEECELYEFYFGKAEKTPYKFDPGDKLKISYQGGDVIRIEKLTESGEPELEEHFFEGVIVSKTDNVMEVQDTNGKIWTMDSRNIEYLRFEDYCRNESGEYIKDEFGVYIPCIPEWFQVGHNVRVCYMGSENNPLFIGLGKTG